MAATSSTSRRRRRTARRANPNTIASSRGSTGNLPQAIRQFREAGVRVMSALFFGAAEDAINNLDTTLGGGTKRSQTPRATRTEPAEGAATPTRKRGRPRKAARTAPAAAGALDLATLGRNNTLIDSVYRNLPPAGSQTNIADLQARCARDLNKEIRNQDVGSALNRLQKAGIVRRFGEKNVNVETVRLRDAA